MKLKTKFQDEDFDLGEVVEANIYNGGSGRIKVITEPAKGGMITFYFESLKELNEMFEDYEEPKEEYWYFDSDGDVRSCIRNDELDKKAKEIGNYFDTREEAEKAVEKLKAWKRLRDKGFRFSKDWVYRYDQPKVENHTYFELVAICEDGIRFDDLDLLFGGEE